MPDSSNGRGSIFATPSGIPVNTDVGGLTVGGVQHQPPEEMGPDSQHPVFQDYAPSWLLVSHLWARTKGMRQAGVAHLPAEEAEEILSGGDNTENEWARGGGSRYARRLNRSYLLNPYRQTVGEAAGKPFEQPIQPTIDGENADELPEVWENFLENVDARGTGVTEFGREFFKLGLHHGCRFILTTMPPGVDGETPEERTLRDPIPYWVEVPGPRVTWVDGAFRKLEGEESPRFVVTDFRYEDEVVTKVGEFGRERRRAIKRWTETRWEHYVEQDGVFPKEPTFAGDHPMGEVPVSVFNPGCDGHQFWGRPVFEDVADLTKAHWQTWSDLRNFERFAMVVLLAMTGVSDSDTKDGIVADWHRALRARSSDAKFEMLETSGAAAEVGFKELESIESMIEKLRAKPFQPRAGSTTATAERMADGKQRAPIHSWVDILEQTLERATRFAAKWLRLERRPDSELPESFGLDVFDRFALTTAGVEDLERADKLHEDGVIRAETRLSIYARSGRYFPESFDVAEEVRLARMEKRQRMSEEEGELLGDEDPDDGGEVVTGEEPEAGDDGREAAASPQS